MSFNTMLRSKLFFIFYGILLLTTLPLPSHAQEGAAMPVQENPARPQIDILPAKSVSGALIQEEDVTHPPLKLTPDKSELVRLDKEAGTVIIGNPAHLSVLADSAKTLVLVPKMPGATYITVLDHDGAVLMQRHVIVASPQQKYVRIRRSCANTDGDNCKATQVYYCPDMCHEIQISGGEESSTANAVTADGVADMANGTANAGAAASGQNNTENEGQVE